MDGKTFDVLARGFGSRRSRRDAVKGLAAGLFGLAGARTAAAQVGGELLGCGATCANDGQCNAGLRCSKRSNRCISRGDSFTRCNTGLDCPLNYEVCKDGRCVNQEVCIAAGCGRDADCAAGEVCRNGTCIRGNSCNNNDDCPRDRRCRGGRCVLNATCNDNDDCRRSERCRNGRCRRID